MIYRGPSFLAVVWFGSSPTPSTHLPSGDTQEDWEKETTCWRERGGKVWARSRTIRPQDCLVLYKLFNTLWYHVCTYSKGNICLHIVYAHICTLCSILCNIHIYNILHASHCESYNDNYFSLKIILFCLKSNVMLKNRFLLILILYIFLHQKCLSYKRTLSSFLLSKYADI